MKAKPHYHYPVSRRRWYWLIGWLWLVIVAALLVIAGTQYSHRFFAPGPLLKSYMDKIKVQSLNKS